MKEARDIAGFSVPFVAATALTAYIIPDNVPWIQTASSVTFCLFAISASVLLLQEANFRSNRINLLPAIVCASLCGCCICLNAKILSVSWTISPIRLWAEGFCQGMGETIDEIPFSDTSSASLLKALLTGNKSDLPASVRTSFRLAGASHILALSGLHLGIIYMIVDKTLSLAGNGPVIKIIRNLATVGICGFYSLATGAGPSITRAFIFILTAQTGKLLCRKISLKHTILSSLLIQLTLSPLHKGSRPPAFISCSGWNSVDISPSSGHLGKRTGVEEMVPSLQRTTPLDMGYRRPVHFLPDCHGSPGLAAFRNLPDLFSHFQPHLPPPHQPCHTDRTTLLHSVRNRFLSEYPSNNN